MWSLDYVQVPIEDEQKDSSTRSKSRNNSESQASEKISNETVAAKPNVPHHRLVKQIHVSHDNSRNLMKSGSESSLSGEIGQRNKVSLLLQKYATQDL